MDDRLGSHFIRSLSELIALLSDIRIEHDVSSCRNNGKIIRWGTCPDQDVGTFFLQLIDHCRKASWRTRNQKCFHCGVVGNAQNCGESDFLLGSEVIGECHMQNMIRILRCNHLGRAERFLTLRNGRGHDSNLPVIVQRLNILLFLNRSGLICLVALYRACRAANRQQQRKRQQKCQYLLHVFPPYVFLLTATCISTSIVQTWNQRNLK